MFRSLKTRIALVPAVSTVLLLAGGCGGDSTGSRTAAQPIPIPNSNSAGTSTPTYLMMVDASRSMQATDLIKIAQGRAQTIVAAMPVGSQLIVRALNNDVTVECNDLAISMLAEENPDLEQQERDANVAAVGPSFLRYIECMQTSHHSGTELFGGMAEGLTFYPDTVAVDVYTDGCENVTVPRVCNPTRLHRRDYPTKVIASLPPALIPHLTPRTQITFHAVGRGTGLDAASVFALRNLLKGWVDKSKATCSFVDA